MRPPLLPAEDAEAWLRFYGDHRDGVRAELEAAGLSGTDAERLVGAVFAAFAENGGARDQPAADVLRAIARHRAAEYLTPPKPSPSS